MKATTHTWVGGFVVSFFIERLFLCLCQLFLEGIDDDGGVANRIQQSQSISVTQIGLIKNCLSRAETQIL